MRLQLLLASLFCALPYSGGFVPADVGLKKRLHLSTAWVTSTPQVLPPSIKDDEDYPNHVDETHLFEKLGISREVMSAVKSQPDWHVPTPIQELAIPAILSTNNTFVWCEAPTGSGKTAAYALPLLQKLYRRGTYGVASVVLCPTRELAVQIGRVFKGLVCNLGGRKPWEVAVIHGGVPLEPQIVQLARAARDGRTIDVLVATPGRLVDVLTHYADEETQSKVAREAALEKRLMDALDKQGPGDVSLSLEQITSLDLDNIDDSDADGREAIKKMLEGLEFLVLDEADRLLGRAFEREMDECLDLLLQQARPDSNRAIPTWLFSATFPRQIEPRVDRVRKRLGGKEHSVPPLRVSCSSSNRLSEEEVSASLQKRLERTKSNDFQVLEQVGPASTIRLRTIRLEKPRRTMALRKLLEDHPEWDRVLVFVATRYASEHVARKLARAGISSAELHGKLGQDARLRRLSAFAKGRTRVLLATDVASRGLDVKGLPAVVNYDLPRSTVDFVHRVGRTGRAGRKGTAVTFVMPTNEAHLDLIEKRHLPEPVPREVLPGFKINESKWAIESTASRISVPGTIHSNQGLAHDRMNGGVKGRRKSKKDKMREKAAREAQKQDEKTE